MRHKEVNTAYHLDSIPNTPYFPKAISNEIKKIVSNYENFYLTEDYLAIYAHYQRGNPHNKLVIDTHLDHPGFALKNSKEAMPLGSIADPKEIKDLNLHLPVPIQFHDSEGGLIGQGEIDHFYIHKKKTVARINHKKLSIHMPKNTQAILKLEPYMNKNNLNLRSADNHAVTTVAIELIDWINKYKPDGDITFIFSKLEEIRQVSATLIAKRNNTPFENFDDRTIIIVLEAGLTGQTKETQKISSVVTNYQSGPIIRIADNELVFTVNHQVNLAESLLLHSTESSHLPTQHGPSISNCNATAYTLFSRCPNIASLTVPCINKHNFNRKLGFTHETVHVQDLHQSLDILKKSILLSSKPVSPHPERIINPKKDYPGLEPKHIEQKQKIWSQTANWAESRLKNQKLYPTNPKETLRLIISSIKSKI